MTGRGGNRLEQARERVARWRAAHGGRGIPLPEELWTAAVEAARVDGVAAVARSLRMDWRRLEARLNQANAELEPAEGGDGFVEIDAARLCVAPRTLIRFESAARGRMEIELGVEMPLDVVALARAFWDRRE